LLAGVAQRDQHHRERPLGDRIARSVRRVDDANPAYSRGLDVDAAGKAVAFELADNFHPRRGIQNGWRDPRAAVADDQSVRINDGFDEPGGRLRILRWRTPVARIDLKIEPLPRGEPLQPLQVGLGHVVLPHADVAGNYY